MIVLSKQEPDFITEKDIFRGKPLTLGPYYYRVVSVGEDSWFLHCMEENDNRSIFYMLGISNPVKWMIANGIPVIKDGRFPYLTKENLVKTINLLRKELKKDGH